MLSFNKLSNVGFLICAKYGLKIGEINIDEEFCFIQSYFSEFNEITVPEEISSLEIADMYDTLQQYGIEIELSTRNVAILDMLHEIGHLYQVTYHNNDYETMQTQYELYMDDLMFHITHTKAQLRQRYLALDVEIFANNFMVDHMNEWL